MSRKLQPQAIVLLIHGRCKNTSCLQQEYITKSTFPLHSLIEIAQLISERQINHLTFGLQDTAATGNLDQATKQKPGISGIAMVILIWVKQLEPNYCV